MAHAYLFTGPRGTGKTSTARILAKSLNCETGPTPTPCGVCSSCVDITSGNALDVIEIDAASNRSVDDARDLIDKVQFAPTAGRYKVYIIDEVHMLTSAAFNTLLKTLEEPPPNLVFILATTEAHKVLETIISRCQRFDFRRISQDAMVKRLAFIAKEENINIEEDALKIIARRSAGGLRDALGLLDQISVLSEEDQTILAKDVSNLIGALPEDMLIKISQNIADRDGPTVINTLNELLNMGGEAIQIVKELTIHFRNILISSAIDGETSVIAELIDASEDLVPHLKELSAKFTKIELAQIIEKLSQTERTIRQTSQPQLWLEVGILAITYRHEITVIEDLQKRVEELERSLATGTVSPKLSLSYNEPRSMPQSLPQKTVPPPKPEQPLPKPTVQQAPPPQPVEDLPFEPDKPTEKVVSVEPHPRKEDKVVICKENEETKLQECSSHSIDATWRAILNAISSLPTRGVLESQAVPIAITSHTIEVGINPVFLKNIQQPNKLQALKDAVSSVLGTSPEFIFKEVDISTAPKPAANTIMPAPTQRVQERSASPVSEPAVSAVSQPSSPPSPGISEPIQKKNPPSSTDKKSKPADEDEELPLEKQIPELTMTLGDQARHAREVFLGKIISQ